MSTVYYSLTADAEGVRERQWARSVRSLASCGTPLVYLDCDTYFFGDMAALTARYGHCDWYAREEPGSSRSHYGYDPGYLDEQALGAMAHSQGLIQVPPYNTGVMVLRADLARTLVTLLDDFIWYAWRLLTSLGWRGGGWGW